MTTMARESDAADAPDLEVVVVVVGVGHDCRVRNRLLLNISEEGENVDRQGRRAHVYRVCCEERVHNLPRQVSIRRDIRTGIFFPLSDKGGGLL